ncbi:MAG TPA: SGNH/GDSL hydrolase family protein [Roseiarcus sp.]|nr:SGNH/GDSL hydrolase family protein [Roseiarcus sp.]
MLGAHSAFADSPVCPDPDSDFEANGPTFALPQRDSAPLKILAIGSSSTEGIGATSPANTYPARLQDELAHDDGIAADVRNAGVGGELAAKTLPRLLAALKSGWARLVIWQVGTNDALVGADEGLFRATLESGVYAARAAGVALMLIDPQYTRKIPDDSRYRRFVAIIHDIGARFHVPVVSRYAMMQRWGAKTRTSLLSEDGFHMNDFGYRCVAHALAEVIEDAIQSKL